MYLVSGYEVDKKFYFFIDEDALIRLDGTLKKEISTIEGEYQIVYSVSRQDHRFYETEDYREILQDHNIEGKRISSIAISVLSKEDKHKRPIVYIEFLLRRSGLGDLGLDNKVRFSIHYHDKNWALLLSDKLEPIIERTKNAEGIPRISLIFAFIFIYSLFCLFFHKIAQHYQISYSIKEYFSLFFNTLLLPILVFTFSYLLIAEFRMYVRRLIGPESVFFIGDEIQAYKRRKSLRSKIHWVVLIGGLLSIVASVLTSVLL